MCFFDRAGENGGKLHVLRRDKLLPKHTARTVNAKNRSDLTLGRTRKFIPPLWYKGGGGGCSWNPSLEFLICCSIWKRFYLLWKAFDLLNRMRYILWVVTLLEACDVTNNGCYLGFYQELEIRLKPQEMVIFCA